MQRMSIGGEEEEIHSFLTPVLDRGEKLVLRLNRFKLHSHTGRFDEQKNLLPEPGPKPGLPNPYSRRHTNWATQVPIILDKKNMRH